MNKKHNRIFLSFIFIIVLLISLTSCFNICNHEYEEVDYLEPTCSKDGYVINKCKLCEKTTKKEVKKLPHNYIEEKVQPTCVLEGYTLKTCIDCGYSQKDKVVKELGHTFGAWEIILDATSVTDGLKTRKCQVCQHIEEEIIQSMSYIDLDIINEPFDENKNYICNTYEELLLKFNCALLKNSDKLSCTINFEYSSLQELLQKLCDDKKILMSFHIGVSLTNNKIDFSITYTSNPTYSSSKTYYIQFESLNKTTNNESRPSSYNGFAIEESKHTYSVETSDQLYYALERRYKPICVPGSNAETIYQEMKNVLRNIISENMNDVEKVIAIHDYLIMNVTYDEEVLQLLYTGNTETFKYNSFYLEGVFLDKKAVCEGISKAFASLCNIEGIPCVLVEGYQKNNPNGVGHAWNKVYVNDDWYIVDVTSDGTIIEGSYEILSYRYCLIDEATLNNTYIAKTYDHIVANKKINVYQANTFTYNGQEYDFNIESVDELEILVKYFESSNTPQSTIEFYLSFDYGDSCKDEISKAYEQCGYQSSYIYINSEPVFMLIKK